MCTHKINRGTRPFLKARFHEPTKHAGESTLVGRLEANDQKFDLCHRLVWSADQYPFIFLLNCGTRLDTDRPNEIYLVGQKDLCGRPNSPLIGRPNILDMSNILAKKTNDQLICWPLWMPRSLFWLLEPRNHMVGQWNCNF